MFDARLFESPRVLTSGIGSAMGREKSSPMLPEQRPDLLTVRIRYFQFRQGLGGKELKSSFTMWRRQRSQFGFDLDEKQQPMRLSLVRVFADTSGQGQMCTME